MSENTRTKLQIITELHDLTMQMTENLDDADFLILSMEKRQDLIEECNMLDVLDPELAKPSAEDMHAIRGLVDKILSKNIDISTALENHKAQAKDELAASTQKQKIMGYMNNAMSASGSYMDYRDTKI